MQQKKSFNNEQYSRMSSEHQNTQHASNWVVDSKPLEQGKWSEAVALSGCVSCGGGGADHPLSS